jgi:hypothetical protein
MGRTTITQTIRQLEVKNEFIDAEVHFGDNGVVSMAGGIFEVRESWKRQDWQKRHRPSFTFIAVSRGIMKT